MSYKDEIDEGIGAACYAFKKGCFWIGIPAFLLLVVILPVVLWGLGIIGQGGKIVSKTLEADNVIFNYEWFKQTKEDYDATKIKIKNAQGEVDSFKESAGPRKDWGFEDKNEYARLNSTVLGLKNMKEEIAATYNARAKMINRKIFMGKDLPHQLGE